MCGEVDLCICANLDNRVYPIVGYDVSDSDPRLLEEVGDLFHLIASNAVTYLSIDTAVMRQTAL
jgi:hypothetical protein